jgi:nitrogen fixation protein NifU and related proteins
MEQRLREAIIVDYARRRPAYGFDPDAAAVAGPTRAVHRRNPLCGDEVELRVELTGDEVAAPAVAGLRWEGRGCTVSQASAAMLATVAEGMTVADLRRRSREVHALIVDIGPGELDEHAHGDDDLLALAGIGRLPLRARCAALAWDALDEVLGLTDPDRGRR